MGTVWVPDVEGFKVETRTTQCLTYFNLSVYLSVSHWMRWYYWDLYTPFPLSTNVFQSARRWGWVWR